MVKTLPAVQETRVRSLGWEDSLEKEMATHSSVLAWRIPWTEEPGRLQAFGLKSRTRLSDFHFTAHFRITRRKIIHVIFFYRTSSSRTWQGARDIVNPCGCTRLVMSLFATPWTIAHHVSLSMIFPRQEYWSGLPLSSPGDLPNPGIEPGSPALEADAFTSEPQTASFYNNVF